MFPHVILAILALEAPILPQQTTSQCSVRHATKFVAHFSDLPDQIQIDLLKGGKIADVGQPFEEGDAIIDSNLPRRRLVLAGKSRNKWFVWIHHGGFSPHADVFGFSEVWEKREEFRWYRSAALQGDPCVAINAFLDGIGTPQRIEP